jgi:hypothetical protein
MTTAAALAATLAPIRRRHYRSPEARWKAVLAEVRPLWDKSSAAERAEITDELDALYREMGGVVNEPAEGGAVPPAAVAPRYASLRALLTCGAGRETP